jgi:hypothetical protein
MTNLILPISVIAATGGYLSAKAGTVLGMFRTILGGVLTVVLALGAIPAQAAESTVMEQVAKLGLGRKVKVELKNGEVSKGRLGSATADQFMLEPRTAGQGTARAVRFDDARAVKADGLTTGKKWGLGIVIFLVAAVVLGR